VTDRPTVGMELVNPVAGTCIAFRATAESTDGQYVEVDSTYPPHSARPPRHLHPSQREDFTVLSGSMHVECGEETFTAQEGESFAVEPGVPHQMWCDTDDGAVLRWRTTPALRTDEMFVAVWEATRDADWQPDPMTLFNVITQFGDEFCLC
jgi:quercetin dioxygenase-like cupin family protein